MTFSLVACDLEQGQWGVTVASKFPSVGAVVPWAGGDTGAVATQSYANVTYGPRGLELLAAGRTAKQVIDELTGADDQREERHPDQEDQRTHADHRKGGRDGPTPHRAHGTPKP